MNKPLFILLLFGLSVSLSSCFEMVEELTYTDTDKGSYTLTVNCSQSRDKLKALFKIDSFMGVKVPSTSDIMVHIQLAELSMRKVPGIHHVYSNYDFEQYIFTMKFQFDSTAALNKAILAATQTTTNKFAYKECSIFTLSSQVFNRNETPGDSLAKANASNTDALKLIDGATLTSVYRFTKTIGKVSNKKAVVSKNKKAVMLKHSFSDILKNPELLKNTIQF